MNDSSWEYELTKPDPANFPAAFEGFFAQHRNGFLRLAGSRLRNRQDAEDAVMEAAYKIFRKWERIMAHQNPRAMAYLILHNHLIDFYRRRARMAGRDEAARQHAPVASDFADLGAFAKLDEALETLEKTAPMQAHSVRLRHLADLSYEDVALCLDITPGAAKTNVSLGLAKLKDLMNIPDAGKGDS
ncbi:sigma-70 family RNA polymerase sigma factor [Streptomyces sp. BR123]|uniref:RNA polymerase sigma factor n=1 Tax=Streptomyces sp. BR123 TaxID=2749828 RepID=UPI0015C43E3A|nr:sigma-70 family RNA polymerase sigma factor [Streptomyces sp. BR123]NXY94452.1 sigma-70 family RNA polymerase sigma factor [Streptomyces sp. BR123]